MFEPAISATPAVIACVFILLDVVSGLAKAAYNGNVSSQKMRKGLWSKCASIILVILSMVCSVGVSSFPAFPAELSGVYEGVCAYISIMEIVSIIENACAMNPELASVKIMQIFHVSTEKEEEQDDEDNE